MANSPWAQVRNSTQLDTPPPDPGPWAPIDSASPFPAATVPKAVYTPDQPMDQDILNTQEQLRKVRYAQAHPWGTPENHPGKLGKLAHVFSEIGNVAGSIVAPDVMARFPQTQLGMKANEERLTGRLNEEEKNKALENEQQAQAGHLNAETPEVAPNAQSQRELQGAQKSNLESETKMREHPLPEYSSLPFLTPGGQATEMEKHSGAVTPVGPEGLRYGRIQDRTSQVSGTLNGKPFKAGWDPIGGFYFDPDTPDHKQVFGFQPQPQVGMQGPIVVSPEGQVTRATPGKTLPEGFRTVSQGGSQNIPTTQMRNMGEMAATIQPMMTTVINEVQQMADHLGPAVGRWNQLMVNKGGTDFPEFAGLDTDLDLLASAIVRTHFGARGGQQYREELRKQFGEAQSPQDLINRVQHAEGWIQGYAHAGGVRTPEGVGPQRPANVPEGYHFDAHGPKGAGWYAPAAK